MKRLSLLLCGVLLLGSLSGCSGKKSVTIHDASGAVMGTPNSVKFSDSQLVDVGYTSYIKLVLDEAAAILADLHECDPTQAQKLLFSQSYTINTVFDGAVFSAIDNAYDANESIQSAFSCAITDHSGSLLAVYSGGDALYALDTRAPCSAIKPLSVYAPALENNVIDWSSTFVDKPFKQMPNEMGQLKSWPTNARGDYTYMQTSLQECVQQSVNTAAVFCLNELGVRKSLLFLQQSFGMNLSYEQNAMAMRGEEEILGSLAMGSLYKGFTPADFAGYYQIFANGGNYEKPHTIAEIRDASGTVVYAYQAHATQVIGEDTAYIMNQLMQSVVNPGGTGADARFSDVQVAGKTGTGDTDNWFVGVTPEYSCAVWHGDIPQGNIADDLFADVFGGMPAHTVTSFPSCAGVRKTVCCSESGLPFSSSCRNMQIGYYAADRVPAVCDQH